MTEHNPYCCAVGPFTCDGEEQFVEVLDWLQTIRRRAGPELTPEEEIVAPFYSLGCAIEEIAASPLGHWIVTQRSSGQGDWGYDVLRVKPLAREAGVVDEFGYMLELPEFWPDESRLVGGAGDGFLGGWWARDEDFYVTPARGGPVTMGFIFVHELPSHRVTRHLLSIDLPKGWMPDAPDANTWYGPQAIRPVKGGVTMTLSWGLDVEIKEPLPPVIWLATPHPSGNGLL